MFSSWFGSGSVLRSGLISLVIVGVAAALMISFGPNLSIKFMHIQVLNDTNKTWKIQPCQDVDCRNMIGMTPVIIPPHKHPIVDGEWENDVWHAISVGVLKPNAEPPDFVGCVVDFPPKYAKVWTYRVSNVVKCPEVAEGGGGGG